MWWRRIRTAKTVDRAGVFRLLGSNAVDHADLVQAAWRSLAAFQRLIGLHGPDAELLEHDAFVASRVPATHSSLISAAVPRENGIAEHLDEIERFYDGQPKWGVWIDPARTEDADALTARGLVLDSTPILMAAELDDVDHAPDRQVVRVTLDEVGVVNDAAYDLPAGTISDPVTSLPANELHAYGIRELKEAMSVAVVQDVGGDAFVSFVATLPANRGEHLASRILAHAVHEAAERGRITSSLQASKLGQGIYARLGYQPLGEIHLYERRP
jgi:GNAT superfamily N-acetyltransferase